MKSYLNLNNLHVYILACHMFVAYWFIYRIQTTITLLRGPGILGRNHITLCVVLVHSCITLLLYCKSYPSAILHELHFS